MIDGYWRPGCGYCRPLRSKLARHHFPVRWRNVWEDDDARSDLGRLTGGPLTVPTLRVGSRVLVNPSLAAVREAVASEAPNLLSTAPPEPAWPPRRILQWLVVSVLVVAGVVASVTGHAALGDAADALALVAFLLFRRALA